MVSLHAIAAFDGYSATTISAQCVCDCEGPRGWVLHVQLICDSRIAQGPEQLAIVRKLSGRSSDAILCLLCEAARQPMKRYQSTSLSV